MALHHLGAADQADPFHPQLLHDLGGRRIAGVAGRVDQRQIPARETEFDHRPRRLRGVALALKVGVDRPSHIGGAAEGRFAPEAAAADQRAVLQADRQVELEPGIRVRLAGHIVHESLRFLRRVRSPEFVPGKIGIGAVQMHALPVGRDVVPQKQAVGGDHVSPPTPPRVACAQRHLHFDSVLPSWRPTEVPR